MPFAVDDVDEAFSLNFLQNVLMKTKWRGQEIVRSFAVRKTQHIYPRIALTTVFSMLQDTGKLRPESAYREQRTLLTKTTPTKQRIKVPRKARPRSKIIPTERMELGWYPTPAVGPMAGTIHCLNTIAQMSESEEGRRNMTHVDRNKYVDDMASRDVLQWSPTLMQEFNANFTTKVI